MAKTRLIPHVDEALVLRTWPFGEADLLVSLFTRERGVVKGVARHAMRSRRRFGGALEPGTHVRAHYAERPREDLVRLDSFEMLWSPLLAPVNALRLAGMQLVVEVLEQALPELAPEDNVFRLALTVLRAMEPEQGIGDRAQGIGHMVQGTGHRGQGIGDRAQRTGEERTSVWLPVTYFCLWMNRLMGWLPELGHCSVCGLALEGQGVWWSPVADGVTCLDDRKSQSRHLSAAAVREAQAMTHRSLPGMLAAETWPRERAADLRALAIGGLERHLERRLRSAVAVEQG